MTPIARFPTLDDAESALDWIGVEFGEGDQAFEGELAGDDRDLLEAAIDDAETPGPGRATSPARCSPAGTRTATDSLAVRGRLGRVRPGSTAADDAGQSSSSTGLAVRVERQRHAPPAIDVALQEADEPALHELT